MSTTIEISVFEQSLEKIFDQFLITLQISSSEPINKEKLDELKLKILKIITDRKKQKLTF
jgi:hypothetical protein